MIELFGKKVAHVLLTRFNIEYKERIARWGKDKRFYLTQRGGSFGTPDEWLRHRINLFREYCYPSVMGQSDQNFTWLLTCDPETPQEFKDILRQYVRDDIIFIGLFGSGRFFSDVIRRVSKGADILIISNVDNDDALHVDYIEHVHSSLLKEFLSVDVNPWLVNMRKGYILDMVNNKLYSREMHNCPFLTLFQWYKDGTPFFRLANHSTLYMKYTTKQDNTLGWLQVIHDRNVHNHVHSTDVEIPMSRLKGQFILDDN